MKKLLLFLPLLFIIFGCSKDDDPVEQYTYEKVPVISVDAPQAVEEGETYTVKITYARPTLCHQYYALRFEQTENTIVFDVVNIYTAGANCVEDDTLTANVSFDFVAEEEESYIFKFWQGVDDQGDDLYLTLEIPVDTDST